MWHAMSRTAVVLVGAWFLAGCTEAACTLAGGESGVWVDATELGLPIDGEFEVCLDTTCVPLGWSEHLGGQGGTANTSFEINDEAADEKVLIIRNPDGTAIAGPIQVTLQDTFPNGRSCPPKLRTALVVATAGGDLEVRSR